uniref:DUF7753 domain-containing protein n=1 Tax=Plectus sambesii TaxID=2011161 RepID=A0A914WBG2_9BILA
MRSASVVALSCLFGVVLSQQPLNCNILDPACRARYRQNTGSSRPNPTANARCDYKDIWLIPGKADDSCTRPGAKRVLEIDTSTVVIKPDVVKLPGCFTVEINNVHVLDNPEALGNSFFGKAEYQWWNLKEFSDLKCQNASNDGCGGYGNNCYYCDVCESLTELESKGMRGEAAKLASQFKGINCPQRPGFYSFRKEFCFNDWSAFDEDGDCKFDFFQSSEKLRDYKSALASLQQIGFGTVVAKFKLAYNATGNVLSKRANKERQIEQTVLAELEERRRTWDVNNGQFEKFRDWYIEYRKNLWHKDDYLPWLLYENEVACLRVTFDVCDHQPTPVQVPFGARSTYNGPKYTCNPLFR